MAIAKCSASIAYDKKIASSYEEDRVIEPIWNKEQKFVETFVDTVPVSSKILDIPVGTGRFFSYYAAKDLDVLGLDISENMLEEAREKLLLNKAEKIKLAVGDITNLSLSDKFFEIALCWRLFHLLPEPALSSAIKELCRVTKSQVLIQTFSVEANRKVQKSSMQIAKTFIKQRLALFNKRYKRESWCHIKSYAHKEEDVIKKFGQEGFRLKQKTLLDYYKDEPVNVYLFERIV